MLVVSGQLSAASSCSASRQSARLTSAAGQDCLDDECSKLVSSVRWCYLRPPSYHISSHNRASKQETERGHRHLYACPGLWRLRKTYSFWLASEDVITDRKERFMNLYTFASHFIHACFRLLNFRTIPLISSLPAHVQRRRFLLSTSLLIDGEEDVLLQHKHTLFVFINI